MAAKKSAKKASKRSSPKKKPARKAKPARAKAAASVDRLKIAAVAPSFTVGDLQRSLAWYRDVLGFSVSQRWEHDGVLAGVELSAGGSTFMIGQDDWKKGRDRKKGEGMRVYCETKQDVDALARKIESRGGVLDEQPQTQPWGRHFSVTDPDGFKITIGKSA